MKKKFYKLSDLEVKSFVTGVAKNEQIKAAGDKMEDGGSNGTEVCSHCCPVTFPYIC